MSMIHFHNKVFNILEDKSRRWKGGGSTSTSIYTPTPTAAPTTAESIDAWVKAMPAVFSEQQRQAPLEAQQTMDLYNQYALPLAQADYNANAALYPETAKLQENMAGQAAEGMNATQMPDWMRKNYQSDMNANLGTNAGSPIGADYVSRGMQNQLFEQQKYYRDLGLSLAGRQPLSQASQPATTNYASTFTPTSVMNQNQQGYASYTQAARPIAMQSGKTQGSALWGLV
jgi:hypothetical protein